MPDGEDVGGPRLVWTFPLVRRIQQGNRFLDIGGNIGERLEENQIGTRIRDTVSESSQEEDFSEEHQDNAIKQIQEELDGVQEQSESAFGQVNTTQSDSTTEVTIEDGVFVPTRVNIEPGDTVRWVNQHDRVHKISSVEGEQFTSSQIEPGEEFEHTFDNEGTTVYIDTIVGGSNMSGAVIVGDAESPEELPSESGDQPELFLEDGGDSGVSTARTMSVAAQEKDNMETGF